MPDRLQRRQPVLAGAELLEKRWLMTTVSCSAATYSVTETAGKVTITVTLDQSPSQQVTVQYATSDGTASSSSDYKAASGTLTFPAFQGTQKTFDVYITDDDVSESNETVN